LFRKFKQIIKTHPNQIWQQGCSNWFGWNFYPEDAKKKFENGANLVQLITGMIYEGPQIAGDINSELAKN